MEWKGEKMKVYAYRHGAVALPDEQKRFVGWTDYPLSKEGEQQILEAGRNAKFFPDFLFTSDLLRCRQSAALFIQALQERRPAYKPALFLKEELREIHMGSWDGKTFQEIKEDFPEEFEKRGKNLASYRTPGGESFLDVQKRALSALEEIKKQTNGSSVVLFTHLGVLRTLRCHCLHTSCSHLMDWKLPYGTFVTMDLTHHTFS